MSKIKVLFICHGSVYTLFTPLEDRIGKAEIII